MKYKLILNIYKYLESSLDNFKLTNVKFENTSNVELNEI